MTPQSQQQQQHPPSSTTMTKKAHIRCRRKCMVGDCIKIARKGGRCILHGAIDKKRKRCEFRDCGKVARPGGLCIAHGAIATKASNETTTTTTTTTTANANANITATGQATTCTPNEKRQKRTHSNETKIQVLLALETRPNTSLNELAREIDDIPAGTIRGWQRGADKIRKQVGDTAERNALQEDSKKVRLSSSASWTL
jgi:transposase-like protein